MRDQKKRDQDEEEKEKSKLEQKDATEKSHWSSGELRWGNKIVSIS